MLGMLLVTLAIINTYQGCRQVVACGCLSTPKFWSNYTLALSVETQLEVANVFDRFSAKLARPNQETCLGPCVYLIGTPKFLPLAQECCHFSPDPSPSQRGGVWTRDY